MSREAWVLCVALLVVRFAGSAYRTCQRLLAVRRMRTFEKACVRDGVRLRFEGLEIDP